MALQDPTSDDDIYTATKLTATWDASNITWDTTTIGGITSSGPYTYQPQEPDPAAVCALMGHVVTEWAEYLDGQCVAYCSACGHRVSSTRMPGGMPFMRLRALAEMILANDGEPDMELVVEMNEIKDLLDREQAALDEARALLATTRKTAGCNE